MAKKEIRTRLLYTIREAMQLMHMSNRQAFVEAYINTGIVGVFAEPTTGRILIPKADLDAAIAKRLYYKGLDQSQYVNQGR